jgi:hypothetical protein
MQPIRWPVRRPEASHRGIVRGVSWSRHAASAVGTCFLVPSGRMLLVAVAASAERALTCHDKQTGVLAAYRKIIAAL